MNKALLFLIGCIGLRTLIALYARQLSMSPEGLKQLQTLGLLALIPALVWVYLYITNQRQNAPESSTGVTWWNDLRVIHALLYTGFAIYAFKLKPFAWKFLAVDVVVGLTAYIIYKYA